MESCRRRSSATGILAFDSFIVVDNIKVRPGEQNENWPIIRYINLIYRRSIDERREIFLASTIICMMGTIDISLQIF